MPEERGSHSILKMLRAPSKGPRALKSLRQIEREEGMPKSAPFTRFCSLFLSFMSVPQAPEPRDVG